LLSIVLLGFQGAAQTGTDAAAGRLYDVMASGFHLRPYFAARPLT
jgi:hypothetical protein